MDQPILIDSNIYIDLLRRNEDPIPMLAARYSQIDLAICGIVRLEVLRGIKTARTRDRMASFFDVLQNVPSDDRLWEAAAELAWVLDRRGQVIPATDIIIAASALRIGAVVLTQDRHFALVPGLQVQNWKA